MSGKPAGVPISGHGDDVRDVRDALESARALLLENRERTAAAESQVREYETRIAEATQYVEHILRELQEKTLYAQRLEDELEALRKAAIADKVVTREYIESIRGQVTEMTTLRESQRKFIEQTEGLIASVQAESAQLATLIDTVQSSQFWKLKRFMSRIRARLLRR